MNRIMRRWIKAGALIFVATLVVAACEGPAGPDGNDGRDGTAGAKGDQGDPGLQGPPGNDGNDGNDGDDGAKGDQGDPGNDGVTAPFIFFVYSPFDETTTATVADENIEDADVGTPDNLIPSRLHDIPFGGFTPYRVAAPPVTERSASRSHNQCNVIYDATALPMGIDMYSYEVTATGGADPTHSIHVTQGTGADMTMASQDMGGGGDTGNGFVLTPDDEGVLWLTGHPNLKSGMHRWILEADDPASSPSYAFVGWNLLVHNDAYLPMVGADATNSATLDADGDIPSDNTEPERATGDTDTPVVDRWGDFITSDFEPRPFDTDQPNQFGAGMEPGTDKDVPNLTLTQNPGVSGRLDGDEDVDVFWVGGLTPDAELHVKVAGTKEIGIGVRNAVEVYLYEHVHGATIMPDQRDPATGADSDKAAFDDVYSNIKCGFYYLEVKGAEGGYDLTWEFSGGMDS